MECDSLQYGAIIKLNNNIYRFVPFTKRNLEYLFYNSKLKLLTKKWATQTRKKSLSSYLYYEAKVVLYYQNLGTSNHRKPFIFYLNYSQYLCLTRYQHFFLCLLYIMFFFFRKYYVFFKTLLVIDIDISS